MRNETITWAEIIALSNNLVGCKLKDACYNESMRVLAGFSGFTVCLGGHQVIEDTMINNVDPYFIPTLERIVDQYTNALLTLVKKFRVVGLDVMTSREKEVAHYLVFGGCGSPNTFSIAFDNFPSCGCCGKDLVLVCDLKEKIIRLHNDQEKCQVASLSVTDKQKVRFKSPCIAVLTHDDFVKYIPREIRRSLNSTALNSIKGILEFNASLAKWGIAAINTHQDNYKIQVQINADGCDFISRTKDGESGICTCGNGLYLVCLETLSVIYGHELVAGQTGMTLFYNTGDYILKSFISLGDDMDGQVIAQLTKEVQ